MPYAYFSFAIENWDEGELEADTLHICPGIPVGFRDQSSAVSSADLSYDWDFGDGTRASGKNTLHTYELPSDSVCNCCIAACSCLAASSVC